MIDYHVHSHHSIDASGSIDHYCDRAVEIGLRDICFTNHCELDPKRNDSFIRFDGKAETFSRDLLLRLRAEIFKARDRYRGKGLAVKFGIEVGYDPGIETELKDLLSDIDLDFVIGAIHCLDHICIDSSKECGQYFERHDVVRYLEEYYNAVADLVCSDLFDSVAHFDVYKKYGRDHYGSAINDFRRDSAARVFNLMKEHHVALEVNTAGMRFMNEFYPAPPLMKLARSYGLERITVGSDSHRPADLGKDLNRALEYSKSYGFTEVCTFERRRPSGIST